MSALAVREYVSTRERLGFPVTPRARMRVDLIRGREAQPAPPPVDPIPSTPVTLVGRPSWLTIVVLCALRHEVAWREVLSPCRTPQIVEARYAAMRLIHTHCRMHPEMIGRMMGRDRTTVLYAIGLLPSRKPRRQRLAH